MKEMLVIFIEGDRDSLFIREIVEKRIDINKYRTTQIIKYASKTKDYVKRYITTLNNRADVFDYIFIADGDGKNNREDELISKYNNLNPQKIHIVKYEIESWIIAGLNTDDYTKFNIKRKYGNTENLTKEEFEILCPSIFETPLDFITKIFSCYDICCAKKNNQSFEAFANNWL